MNGIENLKLETRKWKRICSCVLLSLISLSLITILVLIQAYGNGTKFQTIFMLFTFIIALSSACMVPLFYNTSNFKRWHIEIITLGLVGAASVTMVAFFLMLELQHANT